MQSDTVLLFVYNSDRGDLAAIKDYSRKAGAEKASCNLTGLILSPVGMKKGWKRFISELPVPARFLHRDEFEEEFGALKAPAPAVFLRNEKALALIISCQELDQVLSTEDLIALVHQRFYEARGSV